MKKSIKGLLTVALLGAAINTAMAADGTIRFTGKIIAASCTPSAGGNNITGGTMQDLAVNLGEVTLSQLGTEGQANIVGTKEITLKLECGVDSDSLKNVTMTLQPNGPTSAGYLPIEAGGATGVAIALYDGSGALLNLNSNKEITNKLEKSQEPPVAGVQQYTSNLQLRAGYIRSSADAPTVGAANASLPFTLSYN